MPVGGQPEQRARVLPGVAEGSPEPGRAGVPANLGQRRGDVVGGDPARVGQVGQPQPAPPGQRMPGGQHDQDRFLGQADGADRGQFRERVAGSGQAVGQRQVQVAAGNACGNLLTGRGVHGDGEPGHPPAQRGQGRREGENGPRERGQPDAERGRGRRGHPGHVGPGGVQAEQDGPGVLQQPGAGLGRRDWATGEQPGLQVAFQGGDLLGDGSLGIAEFGRRRGEGTEPGHRDERSEQLQLHPISVAYGKTTNHRWRLTTPARDHEGMTQHTPRVALIGDRSANVSAHARIPAIVDALARRESIALDPYWIATPDAAECELDGFDAIWLAPGSPYESAAGAIAAVRTARERRIPFLGTCGGFQYALLEYARNVCGLAGVQNAEVTPDADEYLIIPLECSLKGHEEAVMVVPGTLAAKVSGAGRRTERYHCSYGLNPRYLELLTASGLRFSGFDDAGDVRVVELPEHPFFMGTLFQPELQGDGTQPHPVIRAFAAAALERAAWLASSS